MSLEYPACSAFRMSGRDFLRIAFWSAVTSGNIGRMWHARSSSTQLPEIISAPVGRPSLSARASCCIQAAISRRECSCACPWYCRSVTVAPVMAASSAYSNSIDSTNVSISLRVRSKVHIFSSNSTSRCGIPSRSSPCFIRT